MISFLKAPPTKSLDDTDPSLSDSMMDGLGYPAHAILDGGSLPRERWYWPQTPRATYLDRGNNFGKRELPSGRTFLLAASRRDYHSSNFDFLSLQSTSVGPFVKPSFRSRAQVIVFLMQLTLISAATLFYTTDARCSATLSAGLSFQ